MFSRHLLPIGFALAPLILFGGCGAGGNLSNPTPGTQAGLGTLVVNVSTDNAQTLVRIISKPLGNSILRVKERKAIFYNIIPGKYDVEVTTPRSLEPTYAEVTVVADRTVTISLTAPVDYVTPTFSSLKK